MSNKIKSLHLTLSIPAKWISIAHMDFNRSQQNGVMLQNVSPTILIDHWFSDSLQPLFKTKSECKVFLMNISFRSHWNNNYYKFNYHIKNFALKLNLKKRLKEALNGPLQSRHTFTLTMAHIVSPFYSINNYFNSPFYSVAVRLEKKLRVGQKVQISWGHNLLLKKKVRSYIKLWALLACTTLIE